MQIVARGKVTYLYLNGLCVTRPVPLADHVDLLPVTPPPTIPSLDRLSNSRVDFAVQILFLPSVRSQIRVRATSAKRLAMLAWNTLWDVWLLAALCQTEIACNLQCDTPAESITDFRQLSVTNYYLRGLLPADQHELSATDADWLSANVRSARDLLDQPAFQNAIHCMATYHWHSMPRVRLAILWSGIEGLFGVESEIVFRLSLYIARYLEPDDPTARSEVFTRVKHLYRLRSVAVHGCKASKASADLSPAVIESAQLLGRLVRSCAQASELPSVNRLAP